MSEDLYEHLEALNPNLPPEEECLTALLDLKEFQDSSDRAPVSNFYVAYFGRKAPKDLKTRISTSPVSQNPHEQPYLWEEESSYVDGYEIAATVTLEFDARESGMRSMLNLDFVKTTEGLKLMLRQWVRQGGVESRQYTGRITKDQMIALAEDAMATKELIIEEEAELMKLGPLVEPQAEDGSRRFHIGDILSITTSRFVSPRGLKGIFDILEYMTDDNPYDTQLGRFAEECKPYLERELGEAIKLEVPDTVKDKLSLYKWLRAVTEDMGGDPFLEVGKVNKEDHARIDNITELILDHGPEITDRIVTLKPEDHQDE